MADVDVPDALISPEDAQRLMQERKPEFVPVGPSGEARPGPDPATGIYQRKLSNGIRVNYRVTSNEPAGAALRMACAGGRAMEDETRKIGAVAVGARALSEAGTVGDWQREQV